MVQITYGFVKVSCDAAMECDRASVVVLFRDWYGKIL